MIDIKGFERVFICGRTGSGKTLLAMNFLETVPRLVVVDLKGTLRGKHGLREPSPEALRSIANLRPVRVRVSDIETALEYGEAVYSSGHCIYFVDETFALIPPGSRPPDIITALWTRGRELNIGGWAATQRPTWVPLTLISEADWFFCFRLLLEEDRERMSKFMGKEVIKQPKDKHGFFVMRADWERPDYYKRLAVNRGGSSRVPSSQLEVSNAI